MRSGRMQRCFWRRHRRAPMTDPNSLEPETIAKGGGGLLALLGVLKWVFTTGVTEVKTDVRELKAMMQQMTKDVAELSKALAVASKDAITRKEFEELRAEVDGIQQRVVHIEEMVKQGVVPP